MKCHVYYLSTLSILFIYGDLNPLPHTPDFNVPEKETYGKTAMRLVSCIGFEATLTAKVISWRPVTHMCFLDFTHQY